MRLPSADWDREPVFERRGQLRAGRELHAGDRDLGPFAVLRCVHTRGGWELRADGRVWRQPGVCREQRADDGDGDGCAATAAGEEATVERAILRKLVLNGKAGTGLLSVNVPDVGRLVVSGSGVKTVSLAARGRMTLKVSLSATGSKLRTLRRKGSGVTVTEDHVHAGRWIAS